MTNTLRYTLTHTSTEAATGYFSPVPVDKPDLDTTLTRLGSSPMDSFLHQYALDLLSKLDQEQLEQFLQHAKAKNDSISMTLACERILLSANPGRIRQYFSHEEILLLGEHSPLIIIRSALQANQRLHQGWITLFKSNIFQHQPLIPVEKTGLPPICAGECTVQEIQGIELAELAETYQHKEQPEQVFTIQETTQRAQASLKKAGIIMDPEMRHHASLSPYGLLRKWRFNTRIENLRNQFIFSGEQTSYGKGLSQEEARVSLLMEIVERCSAYADITSKGVVGYTKDYPLIYATYKELIAQKKEALDPGFLALEIGYQNEPLHWITGTTPGKQGEKEFLIPVQALFLFCNLDETGLFSGLGSTGLASGNTLAQAKVSALLEVVERHQENVIPFDLNSCFKLIPETDNLIQLFDVYRSHGIQFFFQEITPASGIPCCKCFVKGMEGEIYKGTAAHLNAGRAIVSALLETPYAFPGGSASASAPMDLNIVGYRDLPNYSTQNPETDLAMLEKLLTSWGKKPCYVDLTRKDMGIPVVKALIPGMEIQGDFDNFSRVHPELFKNYLKIMTP